MESPSFQLVPTWLRRKWGHFFAFNVFFHATMRPKSIITKSWRFISSLPSATFRSSGPFLGENGRKTVEKRVYFFIFMLVNKNELLTLILPSDSNSRDTRARGSIAFPASRCGSEKGNRFSLSLEQNIIVFMSKKFKFIRQTNAE